jgi:RNA polymerase sigma-70 factor, ECF subfamily
MEIRWVRVNEQPGLPVTIGGVPDGVACLDVEDGKITAIHLIRNPDKLGNVALYWLEPAPADSERRLSS